MGYGNGEEKEIKDLFYWDFDIVGNV